VVTPSKVVLAEIFLWRFPGGPYPFRESVFVVSDSIFDIGRCSAQMKFGNSLFQLSDKQQFPGRVLFSDTIHFPYPGVPCSLLVSTNLGASEGGGVSIPGDYRMTVPKMNDTLPRSADVLICWVAAQNATWYDLYVYCFAESSHRAIGFSDTTLILTGTSVVLTNAFFQKFPSAQYEDVYARVTAHGGAVPGVGRNNMVGDIKGFFYSTFLDTGSYRYFYVDTPRYMEERKPAILISTEKRHQAILRAFGVPVK
jgi:hypothetical protein